MGIDIGKDIQWLYSLGLLDRLLRDKTTGHNILWATDAYSALGLRCAYDEPITPTIITGANTGTIQARAQKGSARRGRRTRQHGEVCTPLWVVKKMIDHADEEWFGAPDRLFDDDTPMPRGRLDCKNNWQRYVDSRRMEITCGEAPYLVTRYDVETGERIPLAQRIGILDRKLRVVNENAADAEWLHWVTRAFEACYGYELQGDSLLVARVNLLMTFEEYYQTKWHERPPRELYRYILNRIVWNIWQMDGLTGTLPCPEANDPRLSLAELTGTGEGMPHPTPPRCRLYDWRGKRSFMYQILKGKGPGKMKFDIVIGNPPYQDETVGGQKTFAPPVYDRFLEQVYQIADRVELIHPARFLFDAGSTPKAWNRKMLEDEHLQVLLYEPDSSKVFRDTQIKGGVAITYHDTEQNFGPIGTFVPEPALNGLYRKVVKHQGFVPFSRIVVSRSAYRLTDVMHREHPEAAAQLSKGHPYDLATNIFTSLPQIFYDTAPGDCHRYIRILGRENNARVYKYIRADYVNEVRNRDKYKILLPKANGTGRLGEPLTAPVIAPPQTGATETFLSIGSFATEAEAGRALTYIKTKFARALLGILKTTQDLTPEKWRYVPLQDFTAASDIDWSQPVPAIDRQLCAKYGLDEQEIAFLDSRIQEMP